MKIQIDHFSNEEAFPEWVEQNIGPNAVVEFLMDVWSYIDIDTEFTLKGYVELDHDEQTYVTGFDLKLEVYRDD